MSAWIVERAHVAYLVNAATSPMIQRGGGVMYWYWGDDQNCTLDVGDHEEAVRVGQMLWDECIKSVRSRYRGKPPEAFPGPGDRDFEFRREDLRPLVGVDPVQVLKSCDCYAYQTCKHEEWEESEAFAFIRSLKEYAINVLPGYADAQWGPPKPEKATQ